MRATEEVGKLGGQVPKDVRVLYGEIVDNYKNLLE